MDKVIVIGCSIPGYAVIRALADKNVHIIAMTYGKGDIAQLSRYVSEVAYSPVPEQDEGQFASFLIENAIRWEGALILETTDSPAIALSKYKEILSPYYRIATPDWPILSLFVEKEKTYALAKTCGIPHPRSYSLESLQDLKGIKDIQYPCILKPACSFEFTSKFLTKNFQVNNETELKQMYQMCLDAGFVMILQEIIPGPDENLYKMHGYINSQGRLVGKFFSRKLRQNPPHFGVMRVGVSTEENPEIEQLTEKLLNSVSYRGYFNAEFKRDPRDGELKLIEVNCRMPRGGMLPTAAGVNYPWIIYLDLVKKHQVDITEYRTQTYWIELYKDIYDSFFLHAEENISLRDYIQPYLARNKVFADLDIQDRKPLMDLTKRKISNIARKLFGRLHLQPSKVALQTNSDL